MEFIVFNISKLPEKNICISSWVEVQSTPKKGAGINWKKQGGRYHG